jgi:hypothetical protein
MRTSSGGDISHSKWSQEARFVQLSTALSLHGSMKLVEFRSQERTMDVDGE